MSEQIISKRCSKCKEIKPFFEFHKNRKRKEGYQYYCKICNNVCAKKYHQTKKSKISQKRYQQSESGIINRRKASRKFRKTEKYKQVLKIYRTKNPGKRKALSAVSNAIASGKLPRSDSLQCHYCHKQAEQYHHHKGYAPEYWLDVIPACIPCHSNLK